MTTDPHDKFLTSDEESTLLKLARLTLRTHLTRHRLPEPADAGLRLTDTLKADGAAFVTLKCAGDLRGCIGHVIPFEPLYCSVMHNAASAATEDPRFQPMTAAEEPLVHIEISVMSPLRTLDDPSQIVIGRDGLIIQKGSRRGLLLPQVATEYHWDALEFLRHTCIKAGLPTDAWRHDATLQAFSAQVFGEPERTA